jgi:response regulator RpfG family c-di-GMP phosphodiesterase
MKNKTVLIVDDIDQNIALLEAILEDSYKIKAAKNGKTALKIASIKPLPDIILLDIMMPEMDGYEVLKKLKSDPLTQNIPVIFITAKGDTEDESYGFSLGACDYITKPIKPQIVEARVATHITLYEKEQKLEKMVNDEVEKRLIQEKLLIRQSRLAAMGEMMSAIMHQWKQPLSVIIGYLSLFDFDSELDFDKDELQSAFKVIEENAMFMSQTMNDFNNYFKPSKEKIYFTVKDEVVSIVSMLEPLLRVNNIKTKISIPENIMLYGVTSEFKQVILNLIGNSKDAIKTRMETQYFDGLIQISAKIDDKLIKLELCDNGGGIPDNIINIIFDDYFTTKEENGTGIGLAMSKMIIEDQFNGKLDAKNIEDGVCFTIECNDF